MRSERIQEMIDELEDMTNEEFVDYILEVNPDMERYILPNLINSKTRKVVQLAITGEERKYLDKVKNLGKQAAINLRKMSQ